jgi:hypothetical protein
MISHTTQHQSQKTVILLITIMRTSDLNIPCYQFSTMPFNYVVKEEGHNNLLNSKCICKWLDFATVALRTSNNNI